MCKFLIKEFYNQKENYSIRKQIKKIPAGSGVFIKWFDVKKHQIKYFSGVLIAKRGKGPSSHIILRKKITQEVFTMKFYIYAQTFLGIGLLKKPENNLNAKKYNLLLRPIKWKYL